MQCAGLILAGGQATRFGGVDKAFVQLAGRPFIEHVLARLSGQATCLAISANGDPTRFATYGLPVLADNKLFHDCGPLAGVAAGLRWAAAQGAEFLLTSPVDTPFLPLDLRAQLEPGPAFAVHNGMAQPLCALWPVTFISGLEAFLCQPGRHKVSEALASCAAESVEIEAPTQAFANLNSPQDVLTYGDGLP